MIYSKSKEGHEVYLKLDLELQKEEKLLSSFISVNFSYKEYISSDMLLIELIFMWTQARLKQQRIGKDPKTPSEIRSFMRLAALDGRKSRSHVLWAEIGEIRSIRPELVQKTTNKVTLIKEKLKAARDCQKSYVGNRRKYLELKLLIKVMLEVSSWKDVVHFGKKDRLAPRYVGPFKIIKRIAPMVVSLIDDHCCVRNFNYGRLISYKWLGRHFGDKVRMNLQITLDQIACLVKKKYKCTVSRTQCRNAKNFALNEGEVTIQDHYGFLRSYAKALADSNEGTTVKVGIIVNPDEKTYFDRFYVCFKALKDGWKMGCRRIIALDGCFLRKPNYGEILTAVGRNENNHIFPVAWAVVSVENKDNWTWFLELIAEDLKVPNGVGLTLMSDQHKGLIEAVKGVMPLAEHRQCARHIYDGFRKQFIGVQFRELFWTASKATYPQRFNKIMEKIKTANPKAHQYLLDKVPKTWSRDFFTEGRCCEAVENGFSECFNFVLVSVRHQPIITMLDSIRAIVMKRMNIMRHLMEKWSTDVCQNIQKILEHSKDLQRFWHLIPCSDNQFEVRRGSDAFKVDEPNRTCSCRMWQISDLINDIPHFVNNDINEFEMGVSNSRVVFNDGMVFNVRRFGFNKKKKFGSLSTSHVKMRDGKTKDCRLFPAQRLGRIGMWLGMDGATSDTIEETEPSQPSFPVLKNQSNLPGTQQSQVVGVGGMENSSLPPRNQTRSLGALQRTRTASVMGGVQTTTTTSVMGRTKTRGGTKTRGTSFIPPRLKSQRILNKKVSEQGKGTGSSNDNDNVLE
ncbi:pentatricopeptide repeat-containing protein [Tanacetum coccineum]